MIIRDDIPMGATYDAMGNVLTFKGSNGYWQEHIQDAQGNILSFNDLYGHWYEVTRDDQGNELTFKDKTGLWKTLAIEDYTLRYQNGVYWAGCFEGNLDKAIDRWAGRDDKRAVLFTEAILNNESEL
jgi:hypothetical protein